MKTICAFSSDSRQLYKADIYRALALPKGHILHFRYKTKYVDPNLRAPNARLAGRKVVIFYTHGNQADSVAGLTHVSIREATITDHYVSSDTDVFHVYMELGEFSNVLVDTGNSSEKLPLKSFFAELDCTVQGQDDNWQARVNALKELLPPLTYFNVKGVFLGGKKISLRYTEGKRTCYYRLTQGKRYILRVALGNPNSTTASIGVTESGEDVSINVVKPLQSSAQFDDFDIPLIVENLQVFSKPALLTFQPEHGGANLAEFATNIEMQLHSGWLRPAAFGLLSTIAVGAFMYAQPTNPTAIVLPWRCLVGAAFVFWGATSFLYFWFNKK